MAQDLDVDEWEMYDALQNMSNQEVLATVRSEKTEFPRDVERWVNVVGQFSLHNEYAARMSYFVTLGQLMKNMVRIPIGRLALDPRIHFCWIQCARSGKTTMFDFLSPVWKNIFELANSHPTTKEPARTPLSGVNEFNLQNPDSFTDQALLGTLKINMPNPDYNRAEARDNDEYDEPELIDETIYGALYGSGMIAFDEFEHSGIFKESQHKQETIMLFQKFMNRLDSETHLIRKRLTEWGRDLVVDSQRSLWATTLPPEGLEKVILTKGVFQRMWLYVREVPESLKKQMEEDYLDLIGVVVDDGRGEAVFQEQFCEMLYNTYRWVEDRLEEVDGDRRRVIVFSPEANARLKTVWRGMRKYMAEFNDQVYEALNTFLMNTINNICIAATLCAISERTHVVTARHVNQGRQLTDQSFDSITTWFSEKLKKKPKRLADRNKSRTFIEAFKSCKVKHRVKGTDGWVDKKVMIETFRKINQCGRNKFYRDWDSVKHLFEEERTNKTYVKLKVNEDE